MIILKQVLLLPLFLFSFIAAMAQQENKGTKAATNIRSADYPQVLPDRRVVFHTKAPDAQKVQIDLGRKYDMVKDANGVWSVTTDPVNVRFNYYSLIIDGVAVADPASESFYGMGRMASGIEIPFEGDDFYALKEVPHGDIRINHYYSDITQSWRRLYIYTPPGYDAAAQKKIPVVYILHGGGEDERGWAMQGKANFILDNLIAAGKAKPMIIVMPDANIGKGGFSSDGVEGSLKMFEQEIKQSIIPFVERNYKARTDAAGRALAGLSLGGMHTLYTGLQNSEKFSALGVFSSGWISPMLDGIANKQYTYIGENKNKLSRNLKTLWISMGGKEDIAYNNCKIMMAKLDELGLRYTYSEHPGGHTWPVWRDNLYHFSQVLFK